MRMMERTIGGGMSSTSLLRNACIGCGLKHAFPRAGQKNRTELEDGMRGYSYVDALGKAFLKGHAHSRGREKKKIRNGLTTNLVFSYSITFRCCERHSRSHRWLLMLTPTGFPLFIYRMRSQMLQRLSFLSS
jgi:hypothetical protein